MDGGKEAVSIAVTRLIRCLVVIIFVSLIVSAAALVVYDRPIGLFGFLAG